MEKGKVFTSEAVSEGHPDKVCDQISDAILTECLKQDKDAHVACEVMIGEKKVVIGGEITMKGSVDYATVAKNVLKEIGYNSYDDGFDSSTGAIIKYRYDEQDRILSEIEYNDKSNEIRYKY